MQKAFVTLVLLCQVTALPVLCADKKGSSNGFPCPFASKGQCSGSSALGTCCRAGCVDSQPAFVHCAGAVGYCDHMQTVKQDPSDPTKWCCIDFQDDSCTDYSSECKTSQIVKTAIMVIAGPIIGVVLLCCCAAAFAVNWMRRNARLKQQRMMRGIVRSEDAIIGAVAGAAVGAAVATAVHTHNEPNYQPVYNPPTAQTAPPPQGGFAPPQQFPQGGIAPPQQFPQGGGSGPPQQFPQGGGPPQQFPQGPGGTAPPQQFPQGGPPQQFPQGGIAPPQQFPQGSVAPPQQYAAPPAMNPNAPSPQYGQAPPPQGY